MNTWLVVLDSYPPPDLPAAAAAWAQALGGMRMDHARHLRTCAGVAAERLTEPEARTLAAALTASGCPAFAAPAAMVPRLPRPRIASRLEPAPDALHARVALSGPTESIAYPRIVLVLPAALRQTRTTGGRVKKTTVGIATVALAATTGLGVGKVISAIRGKGEAIPGRTETSVRTLVELVCVGPLARYHAYADRLDYAVLGADNLRGKRNFPLLLAQIRDRTRPDLASRPALDRFIGSGELPAALHVRDSNGLAAVSRWLLLRGAARRLAAAG